MNTRFASITINPGWTPPASIVHSDLIPSHNRNPFALEQQGFWLAPFNPSLPPGSWDLARERPLQQTLKNYQLKQYPGNNNALGTAKLNLLNSDAIYLHDTPQKSLFRRNSRDLSHGCVRVENIDSLLELLVDGDSSNIETKLASSRTTENIKLKKTVYVFLVYMPAWANQGHAVRLSNDIYKLVQ